MTLQLNVQQESIIWHKHKWQVGGKDIFDMYQGPNVTFHSTLTSRGWGRESDVSSQSDFKITIVWLPECLTKQVRAQISELNA